MHQIRLPLYKSPGVPDFVTWSHVGSSYWTKYSRTFKSKRGGGLQRDCVKRILGFPKQEKFQALQQCIHTCQEPYRFPQCGKNCGACSLSSYKLQLANFKMLVKSSRRERLRPTQRRVLPVESWRVSLRPVCFKSRFSNVRSDNI